MSENTSRNTYLCAFRHSVEAGGGWGKMVDAYGHILIDFTDALGSGPLGHFDTVSYKIEEELRLNDVSVIAFAYVEDGKVPLLFVGDTEVDPDTVKLIQVDTTA